MSEEPYIEKLRRLTGRATESNETIKKKSGELQGNLNSIADACARLEKLVKGATKR